jgi:hypothetical protein
MGMLGLNLQYTKIQEKGHSCCDTEDSKAASWMFEGRESENGTAFYTMIAKDRTIFKSGFRESLSIPL